MPSESSTLGGVHHLNQLPSIPTSTSKRGGHSAGSATVRKHSVSTSFSTTSAESSTIMALIPSSSGGGSTQTTVAGIVGPTIAPPGGAVPGSASKRGRKPGPLSKSAREAQRRLNHSIIEKARRTKINDALATLKQLVPVDYLQTREMKKNAAMGGSDDNEMDEEEGEDEELDDDDEGGEEEDSGYREHSNRMSASTSVITTKQSSKPKGGKKQEKEKEFKLEILVRTVVFLQDLLERVDRLEATVGTPKAPEQCTTCGNAMSRSPSSFSTTTTNDKKRKREYPSSSPIVEKNLNDASHEDGQSQSRIKIPRTRGDDPPTPSFSPHRQSIGAQSARNTTSSPPSPGSSSAENKRLPSISSWLKSDEHGPILPSPLSFGTFVGTVAGKEGGRNKIIYSARDKPSTYNATSTSSSYLPSPPPSTHCFDPIRTYSSTQVPFLNLGPGASSSSSSASTTRSPTISKSLRRSPASVSGSFASRPSSSTPPTPLVLTPEDESAASMLLQIASSGSPLFRPINPPASSASSPLDSSKSKSTTSFSGRPKTKNVLPEPTHFSLYPSHQHTPKTRPHPQQHIRPHPHPLQPDRQLLQTQYDDDRPTVSVRQAETPSSMLGIRKY